MAIKLGDLTAQSTNTTGVKYHGGPAVFSAIGTFGGGTVTLQVSPDEGTTYFSASSYQATSRTVTKKRFISPTELYVFDAVGTNIITAANDDLGITSGTVGTAHSYITAGDIGGANSARKARCFIELPPDYSAGGALSLVALNAGMETTVAQTTATVDFNVYKMDKDKTLGSDICATAAQSINSLTLADKTFTITPTGLVAGDVLDIQIVITYDDGTDLGVMNPIVSVLELQYASLESVWQSSSTVSLTAAGMVDVDLPEGIYVRAAIGTASSPDVDVFLIPKPARVVF